MKETWKVKFEIYRKKGDAKPFFQSFEIEVDPKEYVLDGIERIWAFHDRSLTFRHACHHSTCGACGMRVNGVEKLTCITPINEVARNGGTIRVEPLRNFTVLSDLVVDMGDFYQRIEATEMSQIALLKDADLPYEKNQIRKDDLEIERLVDCIECGLCISACPAACTSSEYYGPAVLAAIQHSYCEKENKDLLSLADNENGLWRCHSAYECSAVCPSNVDPGWRIMNLRKKVTVHKLTNLFHPGKKEQ
ncbi:MAG: 2Fe-2S iron-sulfur cluster-binding protein [Anaerolineaceae bacterium]